MYSTKVNGEVLEFATSGLLYRSNKLMYDRGTQTLWRQFTGEPVVGRLADSGIKLEMLPVLLTTWGEWRAAHPDTTVLSPETGFYAAETYTPEWDAESIYFRYRQQPGTMFPVWQKSDLLPEKEEVLGLTVNGEAQAYPLEALRNQPVLNDSLGGRDLVIVTLGAVAGARAYDRGNHEFSAAGPGESGVESLILVDEAGKEWRIEEAALVQIEDPAQRLSRLPSHVSYWFGWYAFNLETGVYGQNRPEP